ncbi:aldo/keto reductase [Aurantiacibacter spongiae]|uniref:Aldo/keto reductase n=1 Tax=Aurantiacibacter spongiae TaxID=2488860 RepID=A0A3N5CU36_9SPHN|nr:aldo/keto reductase [Aurantiacibacter spongiae]
MQYNQFGRTGLFVSELCLGTMTFGGGDGMWQKIGKLQQDEATQMVRTAIDGGINFLDTANVYAEGLSEKITGQAIRDLGLARDEVVVATKAYGPMGEGVNQRGAGRGHLLNAIDASLDRLGMDHVDLYQIHGWDPAAPVEETLRALETIVASGRARYVGVSNWAAWQIAKALGIAERLGIAAPVSLQAYYSLVGRGLEREIVPLLESETLGLMVWSPLAGGFLSGKYTRDKGAEGRRADFDFPPVDKEHGFAILDIMREIADARGASVAQVALAWLLAKPVVTSVIVGAKKTHQLEDNLGAVDVSLSDEDMERLDKASALRPEYPGWMIERQSSYRSGGRAGDPPKDD